MDLVLCGHEHNYERSLAVRGVVTGSETLTPDPVSAAGLHRHRPRHRAHSVSATAGANGKRTSTYTKEQAVWTGVRDIEHPYDFAAFTVDPGRHAGDTTRMHVTYYDVNKPQARRRAVGLRDVHAAPPPLRRSQRVAVPAARHRAAGTPQLTAPPARTAPR